MDLHQEARGAQAALSTNAVVLSRCRTGVRAMALAAVAGLCVALVPPGVQAQDAGGAEVVEGRPLIAHSSAETRAATLPDPSTIDPQMMLGLLATSQLEFFDDLEKQSLVCHDDALHACLLLGAGINATTYEQRKAMAGKLGWISASFDRPAREAATLGETCRMLARMMGKPESTTQEEAMSVVAALGTKGPDHAPALIPEHLRPYQGLTGAQLLTILGAVHDEVSPRVRTGLNSRTPQAAQSAHDALTPTSRPTPEQTTPVASSVPAPSGAPSNAGDVPGGPNAAAPVATIEMTQADAPEPQATEVDRVVRDVMDSLRSAQIASEPVEPAPAPVPAPAAPAPPEHDLPVARVEEPAPMPEAANAPEAIVDAPASVSDPVQTPTAAPTLESSPIAGAPQPAVTVEPLPAVAPARPEPVAAAAHAPAPALATTSGQTEPSGPIRLTPVGPSGTAAAPSREAVDAPPLAQARVVEPDAVEAPTEDPVMSDPVLSDPGKFSPFRPGKPVRRPGEDEPLGGRGSGLSRRR